jgi:uncharacterized LabA/DUF88 family protein
VKVRVYIDGFNLYYGALKGTPHKWLDLVEFSRQLLRRGETLDYVRYFTAPVGGPSGARQNVYLRALETLTPLSIHRGVYQENVDIRPLAGQVASGMADVIEHRPGMAGAWIPEPRPFVGEQVRVSIIDTEEKGSDVNLATYLLFDGMRGKYDGAVVVSGDSDLVEPIRLCNTHRSISKLVGVVNPYSHRFSRKLNDAAAWYDPLDVAILPYCHLPFHIKARNGAALSRPATW